ncbi:MAG: beta-galactosidase trimerization domain-containing protein [Sedimentisphaerales bacterium]|nr:beta-galactosidase trimerization domain-containing protein [Sedimentisphaerales bacterium]
MNSSAMPTVLFLATFLTIFRFFPFCDAAEDIPWYKRSMVGMEVGPTGAQFGHSDPQDTRYCARFNGRAIVRQCIDAKCEYLVLWARDGDFAYYNSKLLPKAPGLGERDPLGEAIKESKKHNLPIIAYCVVQQGGIYLDEHPEFEMRDPQGNRIGRFCYNSGYLEIMKQILDEQLAYGIQGFHIDMLDQGFGPPYGCWCQSCQKQFQAEYNHPMPKGPTWDLEWDHMLAFRYNTSDRFAKALLAHVKNRNPAVTVDFNYHGNPPFSWEVGQRPVQHADNADFVTGETGVWGFSALTVGLHVEFYRASTPGLPVQIAMQRGVRMYHDQTTRPLNDIRWELLTLLSHGAFVTIVDKTGFDGWLDPVAYERIAKAFREVQEKRTHFGHTPVYEAGLYFSSRTRDWFGRANPEKYFQSFQGAHKALVYEHIPWGVLLDENATLESLKNFPIVLLPNTTIVSDREISLLCSYVEQGGNLILTGMPGALDPYGSPLKESSLRELIGARLTHTLDSLDNWIRFAASGDSQEQIKLRDKIPVDWPFLVKGPAAVYEPVEAKAFGQLMKPFRTTRQQQGKEGTEWPMSADTPVGPAILLNRIGKGVVLTFACSPDWATASEHYIVETRCLLANAIRFLHPEPRIRIEAPTTVQTVVTDDPAAKTLRIHLLGYNSPPQTTPGQNRPFILPGLIEDAPMYRIRVALPKPIRYIDAVGSSSQIRRKGRFAEVLIHDIHEILIVKY